MEYLILNESMKTSKSQKKYKCPFCDHRDVKPELVYHVDEEHREMIPQGYTAARIVFNYINKKEHGTCIQCGRESDWNEEVWKYNRLCNDKNCRKEYAKTMKSRMINTYGVPHRLNDPEIQKQMLANRKISGNYTFKDGGVRSYCGSYERKLLEFYDKVMNAHSDEVLTPGPNIEYMYDGKKHIWITDVYYIPANLVHDVKDGGDNPNTRQMDEYRAKQDAKEEAIAKLGTYNYIRLTDNNFQQLLLILAELKDQLMNDIKDPIIRINEDAATAGALPNGTDADTYIIPYMKNNSFIGTAASHTRDMSELYITKDGKKTKVNPTFLKDYDYSVFKYKDKVNLESLLDDTEEYNPYYFYEAVTGKEIIDKDQIFIDSDFTEVLDSYTEAELKMSIRESSLLNAVNNNMILLELTNITDINTREELISKFPNIDILQTVSGYVAYNIRTKESTNCSYENLSDIPLDLLNVLNEID